MDEEIIKKFKDRYPQIHPLIFHRSVERAGSCGMLFDILETFPGDYPVVWSDESHCWVKTKDLYQTKGFI